MALAGISAAAAFFLLSENSATPANGRHLARRIFRHCSYVLLRNAECRKRFNLRNVPQVKFRKIHLFKFPHSAKYTFPLEVEGEN